VENVKQKKRDAKQGNEEEGKRNALEKREKRRNEQKRKDVNKFTRKS